MKKYLCHNLLLMWGIIVAVNANAEIKSRVLSDGTVEYYTAEKKIMHPRKILLPTQYDHLIFRIAGEEGVDPLLVKSMIKVESNFNPNAVSPAGAMGLMQIMEMIAHSYDVKNPFDPEQNLTAGIKHFSWLLRSLNNDAPLALAAYHAGIGRVKSHMSIPPIKSTIQYVNDVMRIYHTIIGKDIKDFSPHVKKLYMRIKKDGTLEIFN
ncbi:MAG: lytic transglycosylase domain-containing protein [Spirochaetes bacterium]|nr:lytic transglycosylase domain-containing protein [Spirochaetota bacterium]